MTKRTFNNVESITFDAHESKLSIKGKDEMILEIKYEHLIRRKSPDLFQKKDEELKPDGNIAKNFYKSTTVIVD